MKPKNQKCVNFPVCLGLLVFVRFVCLFVFS